MILFGILTKTQQTDNSLFLILFSAADQLRISLWDQYIQSFIHSSIHYLPLCHYLSLLLETQNAAKYLTLTSPFALKVRFQFSSDEPGGSVCPVGGVYFRTNCDRWLVSCSCWCFILNVLPPTDWSLRVRSPVDLWQRRNDESREFNAAQVIQVNHGSMVYLDPGVWTLQAWLVSVFLTFVVLLLRPQQQQSFPLLLPPSLSHISVWPVFIFSPSFVVLHPTPGFQMHPLPLLISCYFPPGPCGAARRSIGKPNLDLSLPAAPGILIAFFLFPLSSKARFCPGSTGNPPLQMLGPISPTGTWTETLTTGSERRRSKTETKQPVDLERIRF